MKTPRSARPSCPHLVLPSLPGRKLGQSRPSPRPRAHRQGWVAWTGGSHGQAEGRGGAASSNTDLRDSVAGRQRASVRGRPPERDLSWVGAGPTPHTIGSLGAAWPLPHAEARPPDPGSRCGVWTACQPGAPEKPHPKDGPLPQLSAGNGFHFANHSQGRGGLCGRPACTR